MQNNQKKNTLNESAVEKLRKVVRQILKEEMKTYNSETDSVKNLNFYDVSVVNKKNSRVITSYLVRARYSTDAFTVFEKSEEYRDLVNKYGEDNLRLAVSEHRTDPQGKKYI
jgi:hypothetical protein